MRFIIFCLVCTIVMAAGLGLGFILWVHFSWTDALLYAATPLVLALLFLIIGDKANARQGRNR